ncbi:GIY-YIG nuclease family protein [Candidatus Woesearchaeota archaeon]|nr:GIY-YIG nuclease family protein [Candidatus Woesearchaeota archaeon]
MNGIYCLIINVKKNINVNVGALGIMQFSNGTYVYVGSAQNNLKKRIDRHLSQNKKIHWHIDYLLNNKNVNIKKVFYNHAGKEEECKVANHLSDIEEPIKGFGCSDCNCSSHLFRLGSLVNLEELGFKENGMQME